MTLKTNYLIALLIPFALIGFGESYAGTKDFMAERKVEMKKMSEKELMEMNVCLSPAGTPDDKCKIPSQGRIDKIPKVN